MTIPVLRKGSDGYATFLGIRAGVEPAVAMDRLRKWADQDPTMQEVLSQLQGRVYACSTEGSDAQVSGSVQTLDPAAWLELGRAHRIILVCEGSQRPASLDPL